MDEYYRIDSQGNYVPPTAKRGIDYVSTATRFVRAGQSLFKGTFDGTAMVTETLEQHKYSRFAMASYHKENATQVTELLSKNEETTGFVLDKELSTAEHSVFHNETTGETTVSYRGTATIDDINTDTQILLGRETHSARLKRSQAIFDRVVLKYDKDKTTVTGHSLSGNLSMHIAEANNIEGYHFNPAISAT